MNLPLVSVVIPNYNHSPYLRDRIDSVLSQTYPNFEVLILDDCSTDDSRSVIEEYRNRDHVSAIVMNETNSGSTFVQWQRGFDMAKGEFVWIAESDDMADPRFLEIVVGKMQSVEGCVLGFSGSHFIDQDGKQLDYSWDEPKLYRTNGIYEGRHFAEQRLLYKNLLYNASMIVFRKECLKGVDPVYRTFRYCGDWSFWLDICLQGKVVQVTDKLNYFRQHLNKVSTHSRSNGDDFLEGARYQTRAMDVLNLGWWRRHCLKGRMTKRIRKSIHKENAFLAHQYPQVYCGTLLDVFIYELDKIFSVKSLS